jgi:hypothetical protein
VNEQEIIALQRHANRAAEEFGCHAGIQVADFIASAGDPPGSLRLKIVVAHRTREGKLLSHESNVVLMTEEHAESVERIVRDAAAKLTEAVTTRCR